ncbi:hypothetical protein PGA1_c21590 [Phaeobacter inhibens DSM 17395]|nr:hypothetical protein PGA1_c21590 [Phaeobacter inhibens DSM 17395]
MSALRYARICCRDGGESLWEIRALEPILRDQGGLFAKCDQFERPHALAPTFASLFDTGTESAP